MDTNDIVGSQGAVFTNDFMDLENIELNQVFQVYVPVFENNNSLEQQQLYYNTESNEVQAIVNEQLAFLDNKKRKRESDEISTADKIEKEKKEEDLYMPPEVSQEDSEELVDGELVPEEIEPFPEVEDEESDCGRKSKSKKKGKKGGAKRERKKHAVNVNLSHMVEYGFLKVGEEVETRSQKGVVTADASILWKGKKYGSVSTFATAVAHADGASSKTRLNGWSVCYLGEEKMADLRGKCIQFLLDKQGSPSPFSSVESELSRKDGGGNKGGGKMEEKSVCEKDKTAKKKVKVVKKVTKVLEEEKRTPKKHKIEEKKEEPREKPSGHKGGKESVDATNLNQLKEKEASKKRTVEEEEMREEEMEESPKTVKTPKSSDRKANTPKKEMESPKTVQTPKSREKVKTPKKDLQEKKMDEKDKEKKGSKSGNKKQLDLREMFSSMKTRKNASPPPQSPASRFSKKGNNTSTNSSNSINSSNKANKSSPQQKLQNKSSSASNKSSSASTLSTPSMSSPHPKNSKSSAQMETSSPQGVGLDGSYWQVSGDSRSRRGRDLKFFADDHIKRKQYVRRPLTEEEAQKQRERSQQYQARKKEEGKRQREERQKREEDHVAFETHGRLVTDHVFIGGCHVAGNREWVEENVSLVVNLSKRDFRYSQDVTCLKIDVEDSQTENISTHFERVNEMIQQHVTQDKSVLVHCMKGKSRSASFVLAYLVSCKRMFLSDAYDLLHEVNRGLSINSGFINQLMEFEKKVFDLQVSTLFKQIFSRSKDNILELSK